MPWQSFRRIVQMKEFDIKKLTLLVAVIVGLAGTNAFAYERSSNQYENHGSNTLVRGSRLDWQVNKLNRMLAHVRYQLKRYHPDWRLRRDMDRVATDVNRVNYRYRHGSDSLRLRREIDRLRGELHRIEDRLHVRRGDWFRWDD